MTESDHVKMLDLLSSIRGRFLLHGYPSDMYDSFARENTLDTIEISVKKHSSSGKVKPDAIEKLWANYDLNKRINK